MADNTIIRPPTPKYGIREVVYFRESAMLGYLEPAKVHDIKFNASLNKTFYVFAYKKRPPNNQIAGDAIDLKSSKVISVVEEELLTYTEALAIKRTHLLAELDKTNTQIARDIGLPSIDVTTTSTEPFDFGSVITGSAQTKAYSVVNNGDGPLELNDTPVAIVGDQDFTVDSQPDSVIPVGGSSDFVVRFSPAGTSSSEDRRVGVVQIPNNDPTSLVLSFTIEGSGS